MESGNIYHVYNRGNNKENIFFTDENYIYFLNLFKKHLLDYIDVYAYCLMPNHYHFLIKIKESIKAVKVSEQFRRLFISYSQAINKQENRVGSLFQKGFKKKLIGDESYLTALIGYIHYNPVKASLCETCDRWKYSSYNSILSNETTVIKRDIVVNWFGNKEEFIKFHHQYGEFGKGKISDLLFDE